MGTRGQRRGETLPTLLELHSRRSYTPGARGWLENTAEGARPFLKRHNLTALTWPRWRFAWGQKVGHHRLLEHFPERGPRSWFYINCGLPGVNRDQSWIYNSLCNTFLRHFQKRLLSKIHLTQNIPSEWGSPPQECSIKNRKQWLKGSICTGPKWSPWTCARFLSSAPGWGF